MLSFPYRRDYCWKCEFDTDVKIENYSNHDVEQSRFYKKVYTKTQSSPVMDCSYESSFSVLKRNRGNTYYLLAFICELFPRLDQI